MIAGDALGLKFEDEEATMTVVQRRGGAVVWAGTLGFRKESTTSEITLDPDTVRQANQRPLTPAATVETVEACVCATVFLVVPMYSLRL